MQQCQGMSRLNKLESFNAAVHFIWVGVLSRGDVAGVGDVLFLEGKLSTDETES